MQKKLTFLRIVVIALLLLTALNAVIAGVLFMLDPTGNQMGMSLSYIETSPFTSYFLPGLILFLMNGVLNLVVAILVLKNYKNYPQLVIMQGMILTGWIIIQILMVTDLNGLHITMLSIGIILMLSGLFLLKRKNLR